MRGSPTAREGSTLLDQFVRANKRPAGFDYLRLILAISIISFHAISVDRNVDATNRFMQFAPANLWSHLLVPMFFALSGFLVAGSLVRTPTVFSFLGLRVIRIVPALCAEVLLSALILGPIFTTLPLGDYFTDPRFYTYFFNIVGNIHFYLPGVFSNNPVQRVNSQLWTIPAELACYATLAVFFLSGLTKRRQILVFGLAIAQVFLPLGSYFIAGLAPQFMSMPNWLLVLTFLCGILLFLYQAEIPWRGDIALLCFAMYAGLLLFVPRGINFVAMPVAYLTVYLGLLSPKRVWPIDSGDYSYGLYLYGYPIQQAAVASGLIARIWWVNLAVALPLAFSFAALSWHLLEKPVLGLRKPLMNLEVRALEKLGRIRSNLPLLTASGSSHRTEGL
jgi:peptidoglycan/LPS O-acetylase OafA/YrhL